MKKRWLALIAAVPLAAAGVALISPGRAADHLDSPATVLDNAADITDVYAFMRPETVTDGGAGYQASTHLVLVMNVAPGATAQTKFSPAVTYSFRVRRVTTASTVAAGTASGLNAVSLKVNCNFSDNPDGGNQIATCNAAGTAKTVEVGVVSGAPTDPVRVYAGRRSDPFFFDLQAFKDTVSMGSPQFKTDGGAVNTFQNGNVLSIVVELDVAKLLNPADAAVTKPIVVVSGETIRNF